MGLKDIFIFILVIKMLAVQLLKVFAQLISSKQSEPALRSILMPLLSSHQDALESIPGFAV